MTPIVRPIKQMTRDPVETFCAEIRAPLVGSLTLFCGDRGIAEELAQEALARALQRWAQLRSPRQWTYTCAFNLARSRFRRVLAERRARDRMAVLARQAAVEADTAGAIAVKTAVANLPPRQRQAVVCRFYAGLSVAETAGVMRCAQGTVKALTSQALANLRKAGLDVDEHQEVATDA